MPAIQTEICFDAIEYKMRGRMAEWVRTQFFLHILLPLTQFRSVVGSIPPVARRETSLKSINTGMTLVPFVQR